MKSRQWSASTFLDGTMAVKMDIKEEMDDECLIKKLEELLFNFVSYAIGCVQCVFLCFSNFLGVGAGEICRGCGASG